MSKRNKHILRFGFETIGIGLSLIFLCHVFCGCAGTNKDTAHIVFNISSNAAPVSITIGGDNQSNTSTNGLSGANGASVSLIPQ